MVVPFREEMTKRHLKVSGDLGRVVFVVQSPGINSNSKQESNLVTRNTTFAILRPLKRAFATPMSSTTLLVVTIPPSTLDVLACLSYQGADNRARNFSLADVHVEGTERIVDAVAKYDVDRYIHVSSHSANPKSVSEFYATKVCYVITH